MNRLPFSLFFLPFVLMVVFSLVIVQQAFSQYRDLFPAMKPNNIQVSKAYLLPTENFPGTFLVSKRVFNHLGYRTLTEVYKRDGRKIAYAFFYRNDAIKIRRQTYVNDTLIAACKLVYNDKGQNVKDIYYDGDGKKTGMWNTYKYNKEGFKSEYFWYINSKLVAHEKYKYHKNGQLKKDQTFYPLDRAGVLRYDEEGTCVNPNKLSVIMETVIDERYEDNTIKKETINRIFNKDLTILGVSGSISLTTGDTLTTHKFYSPTGLLTREIEYINGEKDAEKVYEYIKF